MSDKIHIALSPWDLSDIYNRHTGTTLVSVLSNCSRPVCVHLLYEDRLAHQNPKGREDNIRKYLEIGTRYGAEIQFHAVTLPDWVNDTSRKNLQHFTPGTLLRLYIPEILPALPKILYLDCDMIVKTDISRLWDVPLDSYSLGVCLEAARESNVKYYQDVHKPFGIDWRCYFNAGFLMMNLIKLQETHMLPDKVMDLIYHHPDLPYLDQDVLNHLFQQDAYFFNQRYNLPVGKRMTDFPLMKSLNIQDGKYEDCILHFNGRVKPWKAYSGSVDEEYWKYFAMTPWGNDPDVYREAYTAARHAKRGLVNGGIDWIMGTRTNWLVRSLWSWLEYILRKI